MPLSVSLLCEVRGALSTRGWWYRPDFSHEAEPRALLELARALGRLYAPPGLSADFPLIQTRPAATAEEAAPFDQAASIGWHNDFSTHTVRPAVSLAWLARADPLGGGAWRVASCDDVLAALQSTPEGAHILRFLSETRLPYSFTAEDEPCFFQPLEPRAQGRLGLRFYGRALREGGRRHHGTLPLSTERAISAVEAAADQVGITLSAPSGALLVVDNWHALHDRLTQSVEARQPLRCSWLCFVESLHEPLPASMAPVALQAR